MNEAPAEILLVEDNRYDIELTLRAIRKNNFTSHIHVASDADAALRFIFGSDPRIGREIVNSPRLVLLDVKLPGINGMEVLRQLKTDARTQTIPVVMLTSSSDQRDILESYRLGANSYIVKPVNFEQFLDTVRQIGLYWLRLNQLPVSV